MSSAPSLDSLSALIRAASGFAYDQMRAVKDENSEAARALGAVFASDPNAELHVSLRLTPCKAVVVSVVVEGKQFIVTHAELTDDAGVRH